jgi:bacillithiol system protein YtxJ
MNWIQLTQLSQLDEIVEKSFQQPQVIFKHSTRCSISSMALNRFERSEAPAQADFYYLDLIAHRDISAAIAEKFSVHHESPQVLLIQQGECTYDESHYGISMQDLTEQFA